MRKAKTILGRETNQGNIIIVKEGETSNKTFSVLGERYSKD